MPKPFILQGEAYQKGGATIRGRIKDWDGVDITQAAIASGTYTLTDTSTGLVIPNHDDIALTISSVVFNTLQTPAVGRPYNFRLHLSPVSNQCFPNGARVVRCEVELIDLLSRPIPLWANINVLSLQEP
jgi:hypothetical protein